MSIDPNKLNSALYAILGGYRGKFSNKVYNGENDEFDILMEIFGISPLLKRESRQYWGRELGMCWPRLVVEICKQTRNDFGSALQIDGGEPCDLIVGGLAIETKYRIGSGDAGTLKKFQAYGSLLSSMGYEPVLLIVREDNLGAAITACHAGGWTVITGQRTFDYLRDLTGINIKELLLQRAGKFPVVR
uniref:SpeI n=1 Tax=Sphaerotilus natans TaxID=34103 RepID=F1KM35_9BURK|nr:SpeI [Sphaerotilus natans]